MDEKTVQTHSLKQIIDRLYPDMLTASALSPILLTLKQQRKVSLREIADLILFIADTSHRNWSIEIILNCINDTFENINWRDVYEKFLETDLKIWNTEYLYTLVDSWIYISGIITVPYEIFFKKWINHENQLDFFRILLESDEKRTQVYSNIFFEKLITKDDLKNMKYKKSVEYESNFNSVELFKSLQEINGIEIVELIREKSPEYCILGLASVYPFCENIFNDLLVSFSEGVTSQFIFYMIFTKHRDFIFSAFKKVNNRISLTRMLDIFLEHKLLPIITDVIHPFDLSFDIIILSSRRDHLNLEIWLSNNLTTHSYNFLIYMANKLFKLPDILHNHHSSKNDNIDNSHIKENPSWIDEVFLNKSDNEIFPFTKTIAKNVIKIIDSRSNDLSEESLQIFNKIKLQVFETKSQEKPCYSDKATNFITEILNSHNDLNDSILKLKEYCNGDEGSNSFAKRIFTLLVDNYSNLYKLPNSDMLASFFGELIKQRIFSKSFLRVSLQIVKNSLKFPENEREFQFAFRILEIFFEEFPEFFQEIENIENVRLNLIRKDLILIDEDSQREVDIDGLLCQIFHKEEDVSHVKDFIMKGIEQAVGNLKITNSNSNFYFSIDENALEKSSLCSSDKAVTFNHLCRYIYKNLSQKKLETFLNFTAIQNQSFKELMIEKGFAILNALFINKIEGEVEYCQNLGIFLGRLTIGQNKPVYLDVFDFKAFILKSIEYRRISNCVYFVCAFLKQGTTIFIPYNPWLMNILDLLAELNSCTLLFIRDAISDLFKHFKLKIIAKKSSKMKDHLMKYVIEYDGVLRQVISVALDFSVREICNKLIKACLSVTKQTAKEFFDRILEYEYSSCDLEAKNNTNGKFFLYRNLLINLTKSLIHISSQEPLKASMCGNITHFLKLSMCDMSLDEVYVIVAKNLKICCLIIEKAALTHVNEMASSLFTELLNRRNEKEFLEPSIVTIDKINSTREKDDRIKNKIGHKSEKSFGSEISLRQGLRILTESCFVEKTTVKSIENDEYQEIRSFLIQIGRKMPIKKKDYISEEWPTLLSVDRNVNFRRMMKYIEASPDKDEQCLSLCKYLVGHALKVDSKDDFIFKFINKIFLVSHKTKSEVIGWLIYSDDIKKYNVSLIRRFIEFDLLCVEEFDQALSKYLKQEDFEYNKICAKKSADENSGFENDFNEYKHLDFVLELLNSLILQDLKLCTVYDFIYTIEALNKINEHPQVYEFFQKIEANMLKFNENGEVSMFDVFVANCKFTIPPEQYLQKYKEKYKFSQLNFRAAFKTCWLHYVLYTGSFRFFKIDVLSSLIVEDLFQILKESLRMLIQAYSKRHYLFYTFYCRFFVKMLDFIDDNIENRALIWKTLEILAPMSLPGFITQFIEILSHKFMVKYFEKPEFFFLIKDVLTMLNYNRSLEPLIFDFFSKNHLHFKPYFLYFSFLTPTLCHSLKNIFNTARTKVGFNERPGNSFFLLYFQLNNRVLKFPLNYMDLIDNLNEQGSASALALDGLRNILDKKINVREIVLVLMLRSRIRHVPAALKVAAGDLLNRSDIKDIVSEYETRSFNKI